MLYNTESDGKDSKGIRRSVTDNLYSCITDMR